MFLIDVGCFNQRRYGIHQQASRDFLIYKKEWICKKDDNITNQKENATLAKLQYKNFIPTAFKKIGPKKQKRNRDLNTVKKTQVWSLKTNGTQVDYK